MENLESAQLTDTMELVETDVGNGTCFNGCWQTRCRQSVMMDTFSIRIIIRIVCRVRDLQNRFRLEESWMKTIRIETKFLCEFGSKSEESRYHRWYWEAGHQMNWRRLVKKATFLGLASCEKKNLVSGIFLWKKVILWMVSLAKKSSHTFRKKKYSRNSLADLPLNQVQKSFRVLTKLIWFRICDLHTQYASAILTFGTAMTQIRLQVPPIWNTLEINPPRSYANFYPSTQFAALGLQSADFSSFRSI